MEFIALVASPTPHEARAVLAQARFAGVCQRFFKSQNDSSFLVLPTRLPSPIHDRACLCHRARLGRGAASCF